MAGSLLPLGRAPLRPPGAPDCCCPSAYHCSKPFYAPKQSPPTNAKLTKQLPFLRPSILSLSCHRLKSTPALDSDVPHPLEQESLKSDSIQSLEQWDSLTAKFAGAANVPFLLLQLPQIILNARNLMAGNPSALHAVPWLGMFTGLLGNLSLLSYFVKKRETEVVVVQTLGVVSIYAVISQLAMAEAMPLPHFLVTSVVIASGLVINFMNYFYLLNPKVWRFWEDFITVAGLSALPQAILYIPPLCFIRKPSLESPLDTYSP
ncbi:hypothetical protein RJ639_016007 [Escallonia herrerae]|uniref:Maltose excess protein 1-like, chloroplastic n=1 Tax=Escallonia herrerae TaxID=1293975 RepID=A0AA89AJA3_9ASTE|nr:hypothetical protein RJ639_016007 [Escallonia herrerae]